ncbi:MAG: type II secretion system F family protein [Armatimonadota bacterium]
MFTYKVKDKSGNTVDGNMEGIDERAVATELRAKGYTVLEIKQIAVSSANQGNPMDYFVRYIINPLFAGAAIDDLALFYRQFATMIKAGMTVVQSLSSLRKYSIASVLQKVADDSLTHVQTGGKLSESFARYPWIFAPLHLHLLRAGEAYGGLDTMLERLAGYMESERTLRQKIRMGLLYPKILLVVFVLIAFILIPNVNQLVRGDFSGVFDSIFDILRPVIVLFGLWIVHTLALQNPRYRFAYDSFILSIPIFGKMVKMFALTKFYRAYACLYAAGVTPGDSLEYAANASGNSYIASRLGKAVPLIRDGRSLSDALMNTGVLPPMAIDLMSVGVQTGNIDQMLDKAADYTESEAEVSLHKVLVSVPVILIIVIGIVVGMFVIGFYMNMFGAMTAPQ